MYDRILRLGLPEGERGALVIKGSDKTGLRKIVEMLQVLIGCLRYDPDKWA